MRFPNPFRFVLECVEALFQGFLSPAFAFFPRKAHGYTSRWTLLRDILYTSKPPMPNWHVKIARTAGAPFGLLATAIIFGLVFVFDRKALRDQWSADLGK